MEESTVWHFINLMMFLLSNLKEENDVKVNSIPIVMINYDHLYMLCQGVSSV